MSDTSGPAAVTISEGAVEGFRQARFVPTATATTILLVRHGESAPAVPGKPFPLVDGHGDPALYHEGVRQAELVGRRLQRERVDAIYVTSLRRTVQTAAPLADALGLTPVVERDLREVFLGDWEGGELRARAVAGDPLFAKMRVEQRWDVIPGGEPLEAFTARITAALDRIVTAHPGGRVVAVSHGGVIGHICHLITGSERFAFNGADNASITEIVLDGPTKVLRRFNDTAHLQHPFGD